MYPSWIFFELRCHFGLIVVSKPPAAFNLSFWTTLLCVSNKRGGKETERRKRNKNCYSESRMISNTFILDLNVIRQKLVHNKMRKGNGKFSYRIIQCKFLKLILPALTWKQLWCSSPFFSYFMYRRRIYAPFTLLLISNLSCTKGEGGEGGRESPPPLPSLPGRSEFTLSRWGKEGGGQRDKVNSLRTVHGLQGVPNLSLNHFDIATEEPFMIVKDHLNV